MKIRGLDIFVENCKVEWWYNIEMKLPGSTTIVNIALNGDTCQFHQHFLSSFFVQKHFELLFST